MSRTVATRRPLRAWVEWRRRVFGTIPVPTDRPVASVPGDPAIECVAIGNGALSGWGVASHQLGLVGSVARSLARRFACGAVVRAAVEPEWTTRDMVRHAARLPWRTAQVGILSMGVNEVLSSTRPREWVTGLESLVADIRRRMPPAGVLLVLGIPPLQTLAYLRGVGSAQLGGLIARYNDAARELCDRLDGVRWVPMPETGRGTADHYRDASDYAEWGELVAAYVPINPADVPLPPDPEPEREATVRLLGLVDSPAEERFDRVVRLARSVFRTSAAAFTVLHGDRQVYKALSGTPVPDVAREDSICDVTVGQGAPLVVGDALADPVLADRGFVRDAGVRFYAGYPLRAPDGHYVGALCVFDPEPRDPDDVDVATLRELALLVEAELDAAR